MDHLDQDVASMNARFEQAQAAMPVQFTMRDITAMVNEANIDFTATLAGPRALADAAMGLQPKYSEYTLCYFDPLSDGDITLSLQMNPETNQFIGFFFWDEGRELDEMPDPGNITADTLSDVDNTIPEIQLRIQQFEGYVRYLKRKYQNRLEEQAKVAGYESRAALEADVNSWL